MDEINMKPMEELLTDRYSPDHAARIIDRMIISYILAVLAEKRSEIARADVSEEIWLMVEIRDRIRQCN